MGYKKSVFLIINGVIALIAVIGFYYSLGAIRTEIDPVTFQAVGDTAAVDVSVNFSLWLTYGALGLIAIFTIYAILTNPKRFIPTFIGFGIFGVIFLIAYSMANVETSGPITTLQYSTEGWIKWSDIGIKMTYILVIIAVLALVVQMVRNMLTFFSK